MNDSIHTNRNILGRNELEWQNITLIDPKDNKCILNNLNGNFKTGDFVSIMGPSGAGKSSLLSIITSRLRKDNSPLSIQG